MAWPPVAAPESRVNADQLEMDRMAAGIHQFILDNRVRLTLIVVVIFLVENIVTGVRPHGLFDPEQPAGVVGAVLLLCGVLLRSWAAGVVKKTRSLAKEGPYALTRHPLYIGSFLTAVGVVMILGKVENYFMVAGVVLVLYLPKIRQEDAKLAEVFGEDWQAYLKTTSVLGPKRLPIKLRAGWSPSQWMRNREYRGFSGGLLCLLALFIWSLLAA